MNTPKITDTSRIFNTLVSVFAGGITLGGIAMGGWFYVFYKNNEETNDAQIEQYVTPVMSRVSGYINKVWYTENAFVHKGDTLVSIDNREYKAKLDMAYADFENALKNENVIENKAQTTKGTIAIHQAQLDATKAHVWETEREYKRYLNLLKEEAATEQKVEWAKTNYEAALSKYNEVVESIKATELLAKEAASVIPYGNTIIKQKKAVLDNAKLFYSYTVITAPYDGWVGKKNLQAGQLVKEGQTLVSVVSKEKWITANFKETQVRFLKIGQIVSFTADATGNKKWKGQIESFSPASGARFSLLPPDNATGNFVKIEQRIPIRIKIMEIDDPFYPLLRAGMNVEVIAKHEDK
ncbi:HlyD family secretion protein [Flectobacillus major]|jgi:membrane fusion protein (multidrug efflux system)|uniref:HlyD family secretion protein n=1 Tax=Flectobacillus major TaxID=103 RepID=UPI00040B1226|nr:HlyD family secretion protein [Flectobacillus major]